MAFVGRRGVASFRPLHKVRARFIRGRAYVMECVP